MRAALCALLLAGGLVAQTNLTVPGVYLPNTFPFTPVGLTTIQAALDVVRPGGTITVGPGTYTENIDFRGKVVTLQAFQTGQVTIDGGAAGPVVSFVNGEGPGARLIGFVIRGGAGGPDQAGGVHCGPLASPTIEDCRIESNQGGPGRTGAGGVRLEGGSATLLRCTIIGNTGGPSAAGGVHILGSSPSGIGPRIEDCRIEGNRGGNAQAESASVKGRIVAAAGAGGLVASGVSGLTILRTDFIANVGGDGVVDTFRTFGMGGAAGGAHVRHAAGLPGLIGYSRFLSNIGGRGYAGPAVTIPGATGGLDILGSELELTHLLVAENRGGDVVVSSAGANGSVRGGVGAITFGAGTDTTVSLRHSTVARNLGGNRGGCTFIFSPPCAPGGPGGVYVIGSPILSHCIIQENVSAPNPGGGDRLPAFLVDQNANPIVEFSNVEAPVPGVGNQMSDPEFIDSANGDYRVSELSPCINAGDPALMPTGATSLFGGPRVTFGIIDIGADEVSSSPYFQDGSTASDPLRMRIDESAWHLHRSAANRLIRLEVEGAGFENAPILLAYQLFPQMPGVRTLPGVPEIHFDPGNPTLGFLVGLVPDPIFGPPVVGNRFTLNLAVPPALAGTWIRFQSLAVSATATNGQFATTQAHDVLVR